jgi:SOS-response transcriptional repressor LexA
MKTKPLTRRQNNAFEFIKSFIAKNEYSPSIREIAEGMNLKSSSTVFSLLQQLEVKGFITHVPGQPRSIRILDQQADPRDQLIKELLDFMDSLYQLTNDPITKEQIRIAVQKAKEAV